MKKRLRLFISKQIRQPHIIPRAHLAQFENLQGELWVYAKEVEPRKSIAKNECTQRDFYEVKLPGEETNNRIENQLARLEDRAKPSLDKLVAGSTLNTAEAHVLFLYISSTFIRTRKMRTSLIANSGAKMAASLRTESDMRESQYQFVRRTGRLISFDDVRRASENVAKKFDDEAFLHVSAIQRNTPSFARALLNKDIHVLDAADNLDFVTSDAPVVSYEVKDSAVFGGFGWGRPETRIAFPLTPRKILIAAPKGTELAKQMDYVSTETHNRMIVAFADRYIYASHQSQALKDMVDEHLGSIYFGVNAYVN